jgi:hypothetical protein
LLLVAVNENRREVVNRFGRYDRAARMLSRLARGAFEHSREVDNLLRVRVFVVLRLELGLLVQRYIKRRLALILFLFFRRKIELSRISDAKESAYEGVLPTTLATLRTAARA